MSATPEISVVVPTYRRPALLETCLSSLRNQRADPASYEVVAVDDASGDATSEVLASAAETWGSLRVITQPVNRGPAAARNAGVAAAAGRLILFVDDDIAAPSELIAQHLAFHAAAADPKLGLVGRVEWSPEITVNAFMRWLDTTQQQFRFADMSEGPVDKPWDAFYTCNLSLPARLLRDSGGFDERFPYPAFEDTDLGIRLSRMGFRLEYRSAVLAWHAREVTLNEFCRRTRQVGESAALLSQAQPDLPFDIPLNEVQPAGMRGFAIRCLPYVARVVPLTRLRRMSYRAQVNRAYRDGVRAAKARLAAAES